MRSLGAAQIAFVNALVVHKGRTVNVAEGAPNFTLHKTDGIRRARNMAGLYDPGIEFQIECFCEMTDFAPRGRAAVAMVYGPL